MKTERNPYPEQHLSASKTPTPAELFALLWAELTDVLGPAAAAILLRRSHLTAAARPPLVAMSPSPSPPAANPDPEELSIIRDGLEYRYRLPARWTNHTPAAMAELRQLVDQLRPLLTALTGQVILRRLDARPEFKKCGISFATAPARDPHKQGGRP